MRPHHRTKRGVNATTRRGGQRSTKSRSSGFSAVLDSAPIALPLVCVGPQVKLNVLVLLAWHVEVEHRLVRRWPRVSRLDGVGVLPERRGDRLDRVRIGQHGDRLHATAASVTLEHVDLEGVAQQLCPAVVAVRGLGSWRQRWARSECVGCGNGLWPAGVERRALRLRAGGELGGVGAGSVADHLAAQMVAWGEDTFVVDQVHAGWRHEGDQLLDQLVVRERDPRRAVVPGGLEVDADLVRAERMDAAIGDRATGGVLDEPLDAFAVAAVEGHVGVDREASE